MRDTATPEHNATRPSYIHATILNWWAHTSHLLARASIFKAWSKFYANLAENLAENLKWVVNKIPRFVATLENYILDKEKRREIKEAKLIKENLAFQAGNRVNDALNRYCTRTYFSPNQGHWRYGGLRKIKIKGLSSVPRLNEEVNFRAWAYNVKHSRRIDKEPNAA